MNRLILCTLLIASLAACSSEQQPVEEKGSIDKATDNMAEAVVERINKPMDKARAVKELEEQRMLEERKQIDN